jgi:transposase-like protein
VIFSRYFHFTLPMPQQAPRYTLSVQRNAVEQVTQHHRPIAQVARQLRCSPQSVKNWIDKHPKSPSSASQSPLAFLPIQVETPSPLPLPSDKIELVTKNGLLLRFPSGISSEALCGIIQQLENTSC